ncbi:MAG: hypothetical protein AABX07_02750 [Nanoarchaeota archaeon]
MEKLRKRGGFSVILNGGIWGGINANLILMLKALGDARKIELK